MFSWPKGKIFRDSVVLFFLILTTSMQFGCASTVSNSAGEYQRIANVAPESEDRSKLMADKSPGELVRAGRFYLANRDPAIARMHFSMALNKDPDYLPAYIGLGDLELMGGNTAGALGFFAEALKVRENYVPAFLGQSRVYRKQGQLKKAIERVNLAMALEPENIQVLMELATIYDLMGEEALSAPLYKEIIEKVPSSSASYNNLGLTQLINEQYQQAITSFTQAARLDPKNDRIMNNLATAYALNGNEIDALHIFKQTVGEAGAYNNLGYLYMTQGRFNAAEKALRKALSLNPKFYDKAQENLNKLHQLRPSEILQTPSAFD